MICVLFGRECVKTNDFVFLWSFREVGVRGSLSRDILSLRTMGWGWVAEELLVRAASLAGGGPCVVFLLIWSQKKDWEALGPPREAEIRYASIWIGGEAWRGR